MDHPELECNICERSRAGPQRKRVDARTACAVASVRVNYEMSAVHCRRAQGSKGRQAMV